MRGRALGRTLPNKHADPHTRATAKSWQTGKTQKAREEEQMTGVFVGVMIAPGPDCVGSMITFGPEEKAVPGSARDA